MTGWTRWGESRVEGCVKSSDARFPGQKKKIRNLISSTSLVLFYVDPFYPSNLGLLSPHHSHPLPSPALRPLYFTTGEGGLLL